LAAEELAGRIADAVGPAVHDLGYELVQVRVFGGQHSRVQVMVERADGAAMDVEDCATVSRTISPILDVEDLIRSAYTLEVSSPGIDRPLVRLADFARFAGFEAQVELTRPIERRRKWRGTVLGIDGDQVRISVEGAEMAIAYADIQRAKLLLTDALLRAAGQPTSQQG
jgi:ribosome maturation factor RimP